MSFCRLRGRVRMIAVRTLSCMRSRTRRIEHVERMLAMGNHFNGRVASGKAHARRQCRGSKRALETATKQDQKRLTIRRT